MTSGASAPVSVTPPGHASAAAAARRGIRRRPGAAAAPPPEPVDGHLAGHRAASTTTPLAHGVDRAGDGPLELGVGVILG